MNKDLLAMGCELVQVVQWTRASGSQRGPWQPEEYCF